MLMTERILSTDDRERLLPVIDRARDSWMTYAPYLERFRSELRRTRAVPPSKLPGDVITMNSRFVLSYPGDEASISYTLVYPEEEAPQMGKVSVLSPMGAALLGARVDGEVCWIANDGPQAATVQRLLYQPEAEGSSR